MVIIIVLNRADEAGALKSAENFQEMHMLIATSKVQTSKASINLKKLCRHFSHKVQATFDDHQGEVHFPFGDAFMTAEDDTLQIRVQAAGEEELARVKEVVGGHLLRFAADENLQVDWVASA